MLRCKDCKKRLAHAFQIRCDACAKQYSAKKKLAGVFSKAARLWSSVLNTKIKKGK